MVSSLAASAANWAQLFILECGREQAQMIPSAQLVVGDAGRIGEGSIQLPCLDAEHAARARGMAGEAILPAGVVPGLLMDFTGGGLDLDFLGRAGAEQIRIAAVRPPFVDHAVHAALRVAHQQPRFQAGA